MRALRAAVDTLGLELRHGARSLKRSPGFTVTAALTLGLGIGANAAVFSVVHAVLLRPLPHPAEAPEQVLLLDERDRRWDQAIGVAYPNFLDWQRLSRSFSALAAFRDTRYNLLGAGEPIRVPVRQATLSYLEIMGIRPVAGRAWAAGEATPGAAGVALLDESLARNRFGSAPAALGQTLWMEERAYTVIGVVPRDVDPLPRERVYVPLEPWADNPETRDRAIHQDIRVLGRLRPGVTLEAAAVEMLEVAAHLEREHPGSNTGVSVAVGRLGDALTGEYRRTLWTLLAAVGLVLLIACANAALLLLARGVARQREAALRGALGASPWRLARQGLVESGLLALVGGALGVVLAAGILEASRGLLPSDLPRADQIALDGRVLGYTCALSCLTALVFGLAPALLGARTDLDALLREGGRAGGALGGRQRWSRALLVAELGLATVLLIGAGLLIRSLHALSDVDPGFRPGNLLKMHMGLSGDEYPPERRLAFYREVRRRLEALPGVASATVGLSGPLLGPGWTTAFTVRDRPSVAEDELPTSIFNPVDTGFFDTFGIPLIEGRAFLESDGPGAQPVVIVNRTLAERIWPGESAVGKLLRPGQSQRIRGFSSGSDEQQPAWRVVVGVAGDTRQLGLDVAPRMEAYLPFAQQPLLWARATLRSSVPARLLTEPAKRAIHAIAPDLPVYEIDTMDEILSASTAPRRFGAAALGAFAALALILASVGTYGVAGYSVARRTQEIGLRLAIGARRGEIFRLVVAQGAAPALGGALAGMASALALTGVFSRLLFGVSAVDPLTFLGVPLLLVAVAVLACSVPAIRAVRIDPISALRDE